MSGLRPTREDAARIDDLAAELFGHAIPIVKQSLEPALRAGAVDPAFEDAKGLLRTLLDGDENFESKAFDRLTDDLTAKLTDSEISSSVETRARRLAHRATRHWVDLLRDALRVQQPLLLCADLLPPTLREPIVESWDGAPTWYEAWESLFTYEGLTGEEASEMMSALHRTFAAKESAVLPLGVELRNVVLEKGPSLLWAQLASDGHAALRERTLVSGRLHVGDAPWGVIARARASLERFMVEADDCWQAGVLASAYPNDGMVYCICDVKDADSSADVSQRLDQRLDQDFSAYSPKISVLEPPAAPTQETVYDMA